MKRMTYQYQLLRYMPDRVSGEFVNVGVVMYEPGQKFLKMEAIGKYRRITQFFEGINGSFLLQNLRHIEQRISHMSEQLSSEVPFEIPENLESITSRFLPKDDSALFFTAVSKGVDLDVNEAFERLAARYLFEEEEGKHRYTDKEVWQKIYKPFFEKQGIAKKLQQKTVITSTDEIVFDFAYKNGHWNCLESANFDLSHRDSIENKVFRIIGKLDALSRSSEELEYHILAHLKEGDQEMNQYIKSKLHEHQLGNARINLVTEKKVDGFLKRVKKDLTEAD